MNKYAPEGTDYFSRSSITRGFFTSISYSIRIKIFQFFLSIYNPTEGLKILDIGVTPDTSLVDSNYFEKLYPYQHKITAVSMENIDILKKHFPKVTFISCDGRFLPFCNSEFDIAFCSAVIEHVGLYEDQKLLINEILRVSKASFITTPYKWFPVEVHSFIPLIHWLPRPIFARILNYFGRDFFADERNLNLLDIKKLLSFYPNERRPKIKLIKLFGLPSNIIAYEIKRNS